MVTAFAPVNIAWVKYMGKTDEGPSNASFSMTLAGIGSRTRIERIGNSPEVIFDFEDSPYTPPASGKEKIHRFLTSIKPFSQALQEFGFDCEVEPGIYRIHTSNNVPAGTGIATSASGFAALTLAWAAVLSGRRVHEWVDLYKTEPKAPDRLASIARLGSGSACRSFHGPFVEWTKDNRILPFSMSGPGFVDFVLLLETESKKIPSSEAHKRVPTSPEFPKRADSVSGRILRVKKALVEMDSSALCREVREEALEMHELFHTSVPPFRYLNSDSEKWLSGAPLQGTPFSEALITADAGANIHVFVREQESARFQDFLEENHRGLRFIVAKAGNGAFYDS